MGEKDAQKATLEQIQRRRLLRLKYGLTGEQAKEGLGKLRRVPNQEIFDLCIARLASGTSSTLSTH